METKPVLWLGYCCAFYGHQEALSFWLRIKAFFLFLNSIKSSKHLLDATLFTYFHIIYFTKS